MSIPGQTVKATIKLADTSTKDSPEKSRTTVFSSDGKTRTRTITHENGKEDVYIQYRP